MVIRKVWVWSVGLASLSLSLVVVSRVSWFATPFITVEERIYHGNQLRVGEQSTFNVTYHSDGTADLGGVAGGRSAGAPASAQAISSSLAGTLVQTVVGQVGQEFDVVAVIHPSAYALKVGVRDAADELSSVAGKVWRYRTNGHGGITAIDLPQDLGVIGRNFVRSLLTASRVSWPEEAPVPSGGQAHQTRWQVEERGLYGALLAAYEVNGNREHLVVDKTLTQKVGAGTVSPLQVSGGAHITLPAAAGNWSRIEFWQEVTQRSGGKVVAHHRETWSLKLVQTEAQAPAAVAKLREDLPVAESASLSGDEEVVWQRQKRYEALVASSTLASTLADADAQQAAGSLAQVPSGVLERLKAHLALTADAAGQMASHLAAAATGSVPFNVYLSVLAGNSSEASQAVLRAEIAARTGDQLGTYAVLSSLALVAHPSVPTVLFLDELSTSSADQEVRRSSFLAYAVVGHTRLVSEPKDAVAAEVFAKLATTFQQPTRDFDRDLAIVSLGNAGRDEVFDLLAPVVKSDPTAATRQLAVQALRHVAGTKEAAAEAAILDALQHDAAPNVRSAAADALQFHGVTKTAVGVLLGQLKSEHAPIVLQAILKQLSTAAMDQPEARAGLEAFADQCGTHDICQYAQTLAMAGRAPS